MQFEARLVPKVKDKALYLSFRILKMEMVLRGVREALVKYVRESVGEHLGSEIIIVAD